MTQIWQENLGDFTIILNWLFFSVFSSLKILGTFAPLKNTLYFSLLNIIIYIVIVLWTDLLLISTQNPTIGLPIHFYSLLIPDQSILSRNRTESLSHISLSNHS